MRLRTQSKRTFNSIAAFYHRLKKEGVWGAMAPYPFKEKPASQLYIPLIEKSSEGEVSIGILRSRIGT